MSVPGAVATGSLVLRDSTIERPGNRVATAPGTDIIAKIKTMKHSEGFLKIVDDAKTRVKEVTVEQTRARLSANRDALLVDVREDHEWTDSHAAGAIHLGKGIIERDVEMTVPDKATELILYCGGGFRSALAADVLQNMGFTNVFSMAGGWKAWKDSGAPVE